MRPTDPYRAPRVATGDGPWLSVSDLMAGLMMVFLCIAVVMMRSTMIEREKIRSLAQTWQDNQLALYQALEQEFAPDLDRWGAEIDRQTLTVAFNNADAMFANGEVELSPVAIAHLNEFAPRYLAVLQPFRASIQAVHIEGHTSSGWGRTDSAVHSYFKNLSLSQQRSREVLRLVHQRVPPDQFDWVRTHVAALGYSSARPVRNADGSEDPHRSRRVAFRVITNADTLIARILEQDL